MPAVVPASSFPVVLYDANDNPIKITQDGSDWKVEALVKTRNAAGTIINPSTEETIAAIRDTAGIKKITDALPVGDNIVGRIKITDGTSLLAISTGGQGKFVLYDDVNNLALAVADGVTLPENTRAILAASVDTQGEVHFHQSDGDGNLRVASQPPQPPPGTTEFVLAIDEAELEIRSPPTYHEEESGIITNGAELYLQLFTAGAAGDPSERGSRVDILWREGATPTDHVIERVYVAGQSMTITLPNVHKSRDGTTLTGDGSTTKLVIRRYRLSRSRQEVDAVVRGYTE